MRARAGRIPGAGKESFDATLREEGSFSECGDRSFGQALDALKRGPHAAGTASREFAPAADLRAPLGEVTQESKKITLRLDTAELVDETHAGGVMD